MSNNDKYCNCYYCGRFIQTKNAQMRTIILPCKFFKHFPVPFLTGWLLRWCLTYLPEARCCSKSCAQAAGPFYVGWVSTILFWLFAAALAVFLVLCVAEAIFCR